MTRMSLKEFRAIDAREIRRRTYGAHPAGYRGSFAAKPNPPKSKPNPRKSRGERI